jgi:hypothetical protein
MMKLLNRISAFTHTNLRQVLSNPSFSRPLAFSFSKIKKEKVELRTPSIHIKLLSKEHDGFLLYENQEGIRIKAISIAFLLCFLSGLWTYSRIDDDEIKVNYMIMGGLMAVPFLIFQFRTAKTLKRLILDKNGDSVILSRFSFGGFGE